MTEAQLRFVCHDSLDRSSGWMEQPNDEERRQDAKHHSSNHIFRTMPIIELLVGPQNAYDSAPENEANPRHEGNREETLGVPHLVLLQRERRIDENEQKLEDGEESVHGGGRVTGRKGTESVVYVLILL